VALRLGIGLAVVVATALLAWAWRRREGRFSEAGGRFSRSELGIARRDRPAAVLVEFSGEGCAPCVIVRDRIERLAAELPEVDVVTIDAAERRSLAERYGVKRVPTLFIADGDLSIRWRASGVPSEAAIRSTLLGPDWAGRPHPDADVRVPAPSDPVRSERAR